MKWLYGFQVLLGRSCCKISPVIELPRPCITRSILTDSEVLTHCKNDCVSCSCNLLVLYLWKIVRYCSVAVHTVGRMLWSLRNGDHRAFANLVFHNCTASPFCVKGNDLSNVKTFSVINKRVDSYNHEGALSTYLSNSLFAHTISSLYNVCNLIICDLDYFWALKKLTKLPRFPECLLSVKPSDLN